jgi:hypothetical protein
MRGKKQQARAEIFSSRFSWQRLSFEADLCRFNTGITSIRPGKFDHIARMKAGGGSQK